MSVVRGYGLNGKSIFANVSKLMGTFCSFTVDKTDSAGLGIKSLKSNGYIESVFMHTTQTPGVVNGVTNPNPESGYAQVTFTNNFNKFLCGFSGQIVPVTSPTTSSLTAGHVYVITVLGTTTTAQWQTAGLPKGFTPAVGMSFVAAATASIAGTGKVGIPGVAPAMSMALVGDPNTMIASSAVAQFSGAKAMVQFLAATSASDTTLIPTAPADGTVVSMMFIHDGSSVTIDGL